MILVPTDVETQCFGLLIFTAVYLEPFSAIFQQLFGNAQRTTVVDLVELFDSIGGTSRNSSRIKSYGCLTEAYCCSPDKRRSCAHFVLWTGAAAPYTSKTADLSLLFDWPMG